MARDPDGGHARVVMARLLVSRHRPSDAEALLAEFLERHRDNLDVQRSLGRLRAGMYVFDDGRDDEIRGAIGRGGPPKPLSGPLHELFRRGRLAGEFSRAQIAKVRGSVAPTDLIRQETLKGDPLAGFYSQWLMPEETPECPPHAWAWNACRYWQESASADRWRHLATQFPEAIPETEFLLVLATAQHRGLPAAAGAVAITKEYRHEAQHSSADDRPAARRCARLRDAVDGHPAHGSHRRGRGALQSLRDQLAGLHSRPQVDGNRPLPAQHRHLAQSGDDARPGGAELDARRARGGLPHQPVRQDPPQSRRRRPEGAGAPAHRAGHRRRLRDGGAAAVCQNAVAHDRGVAIAGHLGCLPARLRGALCQQATLGPAVPAGLRTLLRHPRRPEGKGLPGGVRSRSAMVLLGQLRRPARALGYARTLVLALRSRTDAARPER